ncbi:MAG TPA: hypothetical protein PKZ42_01810 [Syntrophales bacterium]|nr:hypothetical protein [Syntrophales bacterium]
MIGEEIYNLAKQEMDGEEFESEEDALRAMNVAYRKILAERIWEILKKTTTLAAGTTSLAGIIALDFVIRLWATKGKSNDEIELTKGNFGDRYDYNIDMDYWIDLANNQIGFRYSDVWDEYDLITDYKYKPDALTMETEPVFPEDYHPRIAYEMVMAFKRGDESFDGYAEVERKNNELAELMTDWNEGLKECNY